MNNMNFSATSKSTQGIETNISDEEVNHIIENINIMFGIDVKNLIKEIVAGNKASGISINKNRPYSHLYIGNGGNNISVTLKTLESEVKLSIPKSSFE